MWVSLKNKNRKESICEYIKFYCMENCMIGGIGEGLLFADMLNRTRRHK